jgi:hypothetical protein
MGGNAFPILFENKNVTNLHSLWDSGCGKYIYNYTLPMDEDSWKGIGEVSE